MARPTSIPSCALIAVICVGLFAQLLPVFLRSLGLHGTCPEVAVDLRGRRALVVCSSHEKGWSDTVRRVPRCNIGGDGAVYMHLPWRLAWPGTHTVAADAVPSPTAPYLITHSLLKSSSSSSSSSSSTCCATLPEPEPHTLPLSHFPPVHTPTPPLASRHRHCPGRADGAVLPVSGCGHGCGRGLPPRRRNPHRPSDAHVADQVCGMCVSLGGLGVLESVCVSCGVSMSRCRMVVSVSVQWEVGEWALPSHAHWKRMGGRRVCISYVAFFPYFRSFLFPLVPLCSSLQEPPRRPVLRRRDVAAKGGALDAAGARQRIVLRRRLSRGRVGRII